MNRLNLPIAVIITVLALLVCSALPAAARSPSAISPEHELTPIVVFPGLCSTRLEVRVHNQTAVPECLSSGTFEHTLLAAELSTDFSQVCQDKLLTLVYDFGAQKPPEAKKGPAWRISEQPGVRVKMADYGKTESAPLYETLYAFLEQSGYVRNVNLRVAGYDFRLTPIWAASWSARLS